MRLTAIVPTHDRPDALRACLDTLRAQHVDPGGFELVVVDDGSSADIAVLVDEVARRSPFPMRCERQDLGGLNAARNRGAAAAAGDVLAFLDDDTLVAPGWAAAMLSAFERHACAAVGGRIELDVSGPLPAWLAVRKYYLAEYDLGPEARWLEVDPVPVGANCAVRRLDFERLNGFRVGLDRIAGSLVSNGDTEFFRRLRAAGGRLRYEPAACVVHCVPRDRLTVEFFLRRDYSQGISDELMFAIEDPLPRSRRLARLGHELSHELSPMSVTIIKDLLRGRGTVNARLFASYWRGRLSAVARAPAATGPGSASPGSR
jgi:glucosyl-dolichyl phosphate glucuronosyltransferase